MPGVDPRWHEYYFGSDWLRIAHEDHAETATIVDFVVRTLALEADSRLLDMPCGIGSHSLELARRGVDVTGVDSSPELINVASVNAESLSLQRSPEFLIGDMRNMCFSDKFDAAIVMRTSFGFFSSGREDIRVLKNLGEALVSHGQLLLDIVNLFRIARTLISPKRWDVLADGTIYLEDREYDFRTGRRNVKVQFISPEGERTEMHHSIRIYALHELEAMLNASGFEINEVFGGYDSVPFGFDSKRLIVSATRVI